MSDAHATADSHVESDKLTVVHNRNEPKIVCKNVNVVRRRDGDSNFELERI